MAKNQILDDFANDLDVSESKIVNFPQFILLCGGKVSKSPILQPSMMRRLTSLFFKESNGSIVSTPTTLRNILYNEIRKSRPSLFDKILLAEDIFDKFDRTPYSDLLSFERDLANLCSLTVVIVESSGSIAELGAFSVLRNVSSKTLVIMDEFHYEQKSFIRRGPVEFIRQNNDIRIQSYKWLKNDGRGPIDNRSVETFSTYLLDEIEEQSAVSKFVSFDFSNDGHCMYCILEALKTVQIAKRNEILTFLERIGISKNQSTVNQYLGLLQCFDFISMKRSGHVDYYFSTSGKQFVKWAYKPSARYKSAVRWSREFRDVYEKEDRRRFSALRSILRGSI